MDSMQTPQPMPPIEPPKGPMIAGIQLAPHNFDKMVMEHSVHPIVAWSAIMAVVYFALMPVVNFA